MPWREEEEEEGGPILLNSSLSLEHWGTRMVRLHPQSALSCVARHMAYGRPATSNAQSASLQLYEYSQLTDRDQSPDISQSYAPCTDQVAALAHDRNKNTY